MGGASPVSDVEDAGSLDHEDLQVPLETGLAHRVDGPVPVVVIVGAEVLEGQTEE